MTARTQRSTVSFTKPFSLPGMDGIQPAGDYVLETEEELIEGLSRAAYRRVATILHLPSIATSKYAREHVYVDQATLDAALARDQGL